MSKDGIELGPVPSDVRDQVALWLDWERATYADGKYDRDGEMWHRLLLDMKDYGLTDVGEWWTFITNYLKRAQLLGPETAAGRQALGKLVVTLLSCMDAAIEMHGPMPLPGLPSGDVQEWV